MRAATVGTMCGLTTITNYSQSFFVGPVIAEFGWQPSQFFVGFTLMMIVSAATVPIVGARVPRFGISKYFGLLALSILLFLALGKYPEQARREMAHG